MTLPPLWLILAALAAVASAAQLARELRRPVLVPNDEVVAGLVVVVTMAVLVVVVWLVVGR